MSCWGYTRVFYALIKKLGKSVLDVWSKSDAMCSDMFYTLY